MLQHQVEDKSNAAQPASTVLSWQKTASHHHRMTKCKLTKNNFLVYVFESRATRNSVGHAYKIRYYVPHTLHVYQCVCLQLSECACVWVWEREKAWMSVSVPHLSLQHVSSWDAWGPLLRAVGAPDRQTVSLAFLLGVTGSRSRAAAASALHGHPSYLVGGPAPLAHLLPERQVNKGQAT